MGGEVRIEKVRGNGWIRWHIVCRRFTTEKAGFQVVKDPADKAKLVLAINRQPIAEWFREQFERLRQSIRQPVIPQRRSRRMKL